MDPMRTPDDRLPQPYATPTTRADERIGDAERTRTCDELSVHYAAGRLSPEELDVRLAAAVQALTLRELHVINRDLPRLGAPEPSRPALVAQTRGPWTVVDLLVVLVLLGSVLLAGGMLLVLGVYDFGLFVAAGFGGTAAFAGGAAMVHLAHRRSTQRPRIA